MSTVYDITRHVLKLLDIFNCFENHIPKYYCFQQKLHAVPVKFFSLLPLLYVTSNYCLVAYFWYESERSNIF